VLILTPQQRFVFHGRDDSPSDALVVRETWVENVYRIHESDFGDTDTMIDLGANIGAVAVYGASLGAKVIAVEPEPENLTYLLMNTTVNRTSGVVHIVKAAVSDHKGHVNITPQHGNTKISDTGTKVSALRLEDVFADRQIHACDVLKIDVEGSEYPIIASTPPEILRKCRYITLEFDNASDDDFGQLVAKLAHHFSIEVLGSPTRGGYIYARRYD